MEADGRRWITKGRGGAREPRREPGILRDNASTGAALGGWLPFWRLFSGLGGRSGRDPTRGVIVPLFAAKYSPAAAVRFVHRMAYDRKATLRLHAMGQGISDAHER